MTVGRMREYVCMKAILMLILVNGPSFIYIYTNGFAAKS